MIFAELADLIREQGPSLAVEVTTAFLDRRPDGDVWFFSAADSRKVREIEATPKVHLSFVDLDRWRFISMTGRARTVRDTRRKRELWLDELKRWFENGPESDAIVLIKVTPTVVSYWTKKEEGERKIK